MSSKSKGSESNARPKNTLSQFDRGPVQILSHFSALTHNDTISLQLLLFALLDVLSSHLTSNEPHNSRPLFQVILNILTRSGLLPSSMYVSAISAGQLEYVKKYVRQIQELVQAALDIIHRSPSTADGPTVTSILEREFAKVLLSIPTPPSSTVSNIMIEIPQPDIQLTVPIPLTINGAVNSNGFDNIVVLRYARDFFEMEKIGRGAFGVVYSARNRLDDRVYAIKKIVFKDNSERTRRQAKCALREVRVLASLCHSNIVQYHCAWLELVFCETSVQRPRSASPATLIQKSPPAEYRYDSVDNLIQFQEGSASARENQKESVEMRASPVTSSTSQEDDEDGSEMSDLDSNSKAASSVRTHRKSHSDGDYPSSTHLKITSQHSTTNGSASNKQLIPSDARNQIVPTPVQSKYITSRFVLLIQMQFCDKTLYDWLRRRDQAIINETSDENKTVSYALNELGQRECWRIFQQLLSAVQYLHSRSIVHRDIKPRNIFLSYDPNDSSTAHVRLGDFGLATLFDSEVTPNSPSHFRTDESAGLGTPLYAPPEQLNSRECIATPLSDSYSLGIVLYELFSIFVTETERCHLLNDLRMHMEVTEAFKQNYPFEAGIIEQLVQIDSDKRLTVEQILSKYTKEMQQRRKRRSISSEQMTVEQLQETLRCQERRIQELEMELAKYRV